MLLMFHLGTFIIEYVGELIDIQEYHRRIEEKKKHRDDDHYFLSLDNTRIIGKLFCVV